jgi:hypothetical protein
MRQSYSWAWVEAEVAETIKVWNSGAGRPAPRARRYTAKDQQIRETAYDEGLRAVEQEVKRAPRARRERLETQERIVATFARFSAIALDLEGDTIKLLTNDFLPVGTTLARWARRFDASLSMAEIVQACRNAWTACGLQPLLGKSLGITPSILGYSLLYPYSDNYLDRGDVSTEAKLRFSERFRNRLRGEMPPAQNHREAAVWTCIQLIEGQYARARYPQVFDCLLAIHRAQEESIAQLKSCGRGGEPEVLRMSCAKGGTSVLADACLARGRLSEEEGRFSFEWGVLLQLGDDLQDVREDLRRGSLTLFTQAVAMGEPLDCLVNQLLNFSDLVGARMDQLPEGTEMFKQLLRMSWRSLIVRAVADAHGFFSAEFLEEIEESSPFRFAFLRARQQRSSGQQGLYAMLFDALVEAREDEDGEPGLPDFRKDPSLEIYSELPPFG